MDASFPPFESVAADGTLVGLDVDLARELGRRLGVEVVFIANLPYDGLYDALKVSRVDAVISALSVNPDRMADFAYSTPYLDAGQALVIPAGETRIEGMVDLSGRTIAVEFGTLGDLEARTWAQRLAGLSILHCQTAAEALATVQEGKADVALVDHVSALSGIARSGAQKPGDGTRLVIVGPPVLEEPYAVAVRRENQRTMRAINEAIAEMEADGTLEALVAEWLGGSP
jgi:ABC-type amino acid transport substrate-binding protein